MRATDLLRQLSPTHGVLIVYRWVTKEAGRTTEQAIAPRKVDPHSALGSQLSGRPVSSSIPDAVFLEL